MGHVDDRPGERRRTGFGRPDDGSAPVRRRDVQWLGLRRRIERPLSLPDQLLSERRQGDHHYRLHQPWERRRGGPGDPLFPRRSARRRNHLQRRQRLRLYDRSGRNLHKSRKREAGGDRRWRRRGGQRARLRGLPGVERSRSDRAFGHPVHRVPVHQRAQLQRPDDRPFRRPRRAGLRDPDRIRGRLDPDEHRQHCRDQRQRRLLGGPAHQGAGRPYGIGPGRRPDNRLRGDDHQRRDGGRYLIGRQRQRDQQ